MADTDPLTGWRPDGVGLDEQSRALIAEHGGKVHLRLTREPGTYPRTACTGGLGQWWSGLTSEVTCRSCLELVVRERLGSAE